MNIKPNRRQFIKGVAATALVVGFTKGGKIASANTNQSNAFNPFVKINQDGNVIAVVKHFEMGQGTATGLPTLIAEELGVGINQITYEFAPSNPKIYNNLFFGPLQGTGGSTAMANSFMQYRKAGAAAREMIVSAAAEKWGVNKSEVVVEDGTVRAGSQTAGIGEFVERASQMDAPEEPELKQKNQFTLIGNPDVRRLDTKIKTNGTAQYSIDLHLPNQMVVVIKRSPKKDGVAQAFNDNDAKNIKGFINAAILPNKQGVAVYAENTWAAFKARDAINVEWDLSNAETRSSEEIKNEILNALNSDEPEYNVLKNEPAKMDDADKVVEKTFYFPLLAHAPMEPLNCTIEQTQNGDIVLHDGCQFPTGPHGAISQILQVPMEKVQINTMLAGGSFGRRTTPTADYQVEAALAFAVTDKTRPVKLVWSREDDIKGGYYRPAFGHKVKVGLDKKGKIIAWSHRIAGQSIVKGTPFEAFAVKDGIDNSSVEGVSDTPYNIPNQFVGLTDTKKATSTLWWRSVGHTHTAYVMEVMMDLAAKEAKKDPVRFRLEYLKGKDDNDDQKRMAGVLRLATRKARWNVRKKGRAKGVAVHKSFGTYVAEVVEVSGNQNDGVKIEKITCAVDCGIAVNPDIIKAQMESGAGYGVGHVMRDKITLSQGEVQQSNFPDYEPLRINDINEIEVHIVDSNEAPSGVGEPATPPAAPALANAIANASGEPTVSELPMNENGVTFV